MDQARELVERLRRAGGPSQDVAVPLGSFMRGLALGALVGAAIAGSTIWNRRQQRLARPAADPGRDALAAASGAQDDRIPSQ